MTDRELLELAAKAVGIVLAWDVDDYGAAFAINKTTGDAWSPLTDDGDALRLAVKLNMSLSLGPVRVQACTIDGSLRGEFFQESTIGRDEYAATRRAIVRAAAEIGRGTDGIKG